MSIARQDVVALRQLRQRSGLALHDLAREAGLGLETLRKLDGGTREPLVTTALQVAEALGVEVEELFAESVDVD
jgi:DNA-binding XRE family transcriptional regulator